mmetsp:Transcript_5361/g.8463  ORF Transcript_5361/g.8463 Transcript_5361/m.8463 type:complete len:261 (-) Transcript_5361:224-1006(-)
MFLRLGRLGRHGVGPLFSKFIMHIVDVDRMNLDKTICSHVIQIVNTTGGSITMRGMVDGSFAQVNRLFHRHIFSVVSVQNTIGIGGSTAHRKHLSLQSSTIVVHIVQLRALLVPAGNHGAHGEAVSTVRAHDIGQEFRSCRHRNATSVAKLVQAAFHTEIALPKGTIGGATGHGPQQVRVDFNDLLDGTRGNVGTHSRTRVDAHNDATLELEGKSRGSFCKLDILSLVAGTADRGKVAAAIQGGIGNIGQVKLARSAHHQ